MSRDSDETRRPAEDFNQAGLEEELKKVKTKRLMLNNEIQAANFRTKLDFEGDSISIAEALEMRKYSIGEGSASLIFFYIFIKKEIL